MPWYRVIFDPIVVDIEAVDEEEAAYSAYETVTGDNEFIEINCIEERF